VYNKTKKVIKINMTGGAATPTGSAIDGSLQGGSTLE